MASNFWAKIYIEILDDRKVMTLPESLRWRFIECILLARELSRDNDGFLPPIEDMAFRLRLTTDGLQSDLSRLAMNGLVEIRNTPDGERWCVTNFTKRQSAIPGNDRVNRYRDRQQKAQFTPSETTAQRTSNESVTNRYSNCNESVTNRYTDIDIDRDIDERRGEESIRAANVRVISRPRGLTRDVPIPPPHPGLQSTETTPERLDIGYMANALTEVTGVSAKLNWSQVGPLAAELVAAGYTSDQIRQWYGKPGIGQPVGWNWYKDDFRSRDNPPRWQGAGPSLKWIRETIAAASNAKVAQPGKSLGQIDKLLNSQNP